MEKEIQRVEDKVDKVVQKQHEQELSSQYLKITLDNLTTVIQKLEKTLDKITVLTESSEDKIQNLDSRVGHLESKVSTNETRLDRVEESGRVEVHKVRNFILIGVSSAVLSGLGMFLVNLFFG